MAETTETVLGLSYFRRPNKNANEPKTTLKQSENVLELFQCFVSVLLPRCGIATGFLSVRLSVCLSVRLSVRLSVKRVHCDKTEESYV